MIISIFGGTVLRPGMEDAESAAMERLAPIYRSMPGFISYECVVAARACALRHDHGQ